MKRFLASAQKLGLLLFLMGSFSACAHHSHDGKMGCGDEAKCEDCAKGHCKADAGSKEKTAEKCDGHCDSK